MTKKITIKIKELKSSGLKENEKKYNIYETEEPFEFGSNYSQIKLEWKEEIEDFKIGDKYDIKFEEDKAVTEGDSLKISQPWAFEKSLSQKAADASNRTVEKVGEAVQKGASEVASKGEKLKEGAGKGEHPYALWVGIGILVLILIGAIIWITNSNSRKNK